MTVMNKYQRAIFCLALFIPFQTSAQSRELDRLIRSLEAKYNRLMTLSADFTQVYSSRSERPRRESGRLILKKPGRMRWDYTAPESKLFVCDGKYIYEYLPAEKLATSVSVKESDDLRAPFAFLLGRGNLRRDFKRIEYSSESPLKAGNTVLRMIPNRAQGFRELIIEIEPNNLQLSRLSLIDVDGGRSDFTFSNLRENVMVSDSQFAFNPPAGVEVRKND